MAKILLLLMPPGPFCMTFIIRNVWALITKMPLSLVPIHIFPFLSSTTLRATVMVLSCSLVMGAVILLKLLVFLWYRCSPLLVPIQTRFLESTKMLIITSALRAVMSSGFDSKRVVCLVRGSKMYKPVYVPTQILLS